MRAVILGSGGWMPAEGRETACVLLRREDSVLLLDAGTGVRRLAGAHAELLDGASRLDIVLTHFHLDHVCGLSYLPALPVAASVWAPGRWLYGSPSDELLGPLRRPPISAFEAGALGRVCELEQGLQQIGAFSVRARAQLGHWAPTAGLRIDDDVALITDTAYDAGGVSLAHGVGHLLHEAWSSSAAPRSADGDATGRDAARIASAARARRLTLIHLDPQLADHGAVLDDARAIAPAAQLGTDGLELAS
jgi:ribonuclease BN (tRNA processing enzyme)